MLIIKVLLLGVTFSYSQEPHIFEQEDIRKINEKILKLFKKSDCSISSDEVKMINIYLVGYKGGFDNKLSILNNDFWLHLEPAYFQQKSRKYLSVESLIFTDTDSLLAISDGRYIFCLSKYKGSAYLSRKILLSKIIELDIERIFYIGPITPMGIYFAIDKNNKVYVFEEKKEQIYTYSLEDYVHNHWTDINI